MTTTEGQPVSAPAEAGNQPTELPLNLHSAALVLANSKEGATPEPAAPASDTVAGADASAPAAPDEAAKLEATLDAAIKAETDTKPRVKDYTGPNVRDIAKMTAEDIEGIIAGSKQLPGEDTVAAGNDTVPADTVEGDDAGDEPPAPAGDSKTPMIPKNRLDQVLNRSKLAEAEAKKLADKAIELEKQVAYFKGLADGKTPADKGGDTPTPADPAKVIESSLNRLESDYEAAIVKVAEEFDDGKITMKEAELRKANINRNRDTIRNNLWREMEKVHAEQNQPDPEAAKAGILADPILTSNTKQLMDQNPWLGALPQAATDVLYNMALGEMDRRGIANVPTPEATWALRVLMYEAGVALGFNKIAVAATPTTPTTTQKVDGQSPTADQRKAKLELANGHPPAPNVGGTTSPGTDVVSAAVNDKNVSARDLAKMLPNQTFDKLLQVS